MTLDAPYGAWSSPLAPRSAASGATRFPGLGLSEDADGRVVLWWAETRPDDGGRIVVVHEDARGQPVDVGPSSLRVRSRVNEYGGGVFWVDDRQLFVVEESSQRVMAVDLVGGRAPVRPWSTRWLTPAPPAPKVWRHAAGSSGIGADWVVLERERHLGLDLEQLPEPVNELVALHRGGRGLHPLVGPGDRGGGDFVAAPTVSPDGSALAWLRWDHPDMPWDSAELWAAELVVDDGGVRVRGARRVAGGREGAELRGLDRAVSVCLPEWSPEGRLWWCDDSTDWWHLHGAPAVGVPEEGAGDSVAPLVPDAREEVGEPRWVAGGHRYGFTDDGRIVAVCSSDGLDSVWVFDARSGERTPLPGPPVTSVESLRVRGRTVALVAGHAHHPTSVWRIDLDSGEASDLRSAGAPIAPEFISVPESITFPTGATDDVDAVAHALFYRPTSGDQRAPDGELPPLVVRIHGGPTAAARAEFSTSVQFWTTRGFAVVDVNYRGSVGFGRRYRDLLLGEWGVVDVEDCLAVTRHLAAAGEVDGDRCVIRGGSAGGFTTLAALCNQADWGSPGSFAAGTSLYGVTDLAAMAADTHKFESRYLDGLVAPLPEGSAVYRERSPLMHAERLDRPVLLLQGSEDKVVPPSQAEVLVEALRANGVPHRYVLFPGEGHGFHRTETVIAALELELGFYGAVFGFEPAELSEPFELD